MFEYFMLISLIKQIVSLIFSQFQFPLNLNYIDEKQRQVIHQLYIGGISI